MTVEDPPQPSARAGVVVSHTHWDRAWYLPFEAFRLRLVRLVDRVLDGLDADPRLRAFALDGQTVLVEDYLEIRPEREADLRRHVASGRLLVGPWYVSPDLFLPAGEALVRNLQRGLRMAEALGGAMPVGYVPDPFGHPAQLPQLLRGVGIDSFVFMRGADADTPGVFDWAAPDGSAVLAVYLRDGYFNASALGHPSIFGRFDGAPPDLDRAEAQIRATVGTLTALQPAGPLLLLNGMDHMPEQPELPSLLDALNARLPEVDLAHGTLPDYLDALRAAVPARARRTGDLLGNAHHPILQSVASARLYLKQQNHAAQSLLVGVAEPLAALAHAAGGRPDARPLLAHAWRELLRTHPHDDLCGCSADGVHDDDEARFRHAVEIGEGVAVEVLEGLRAEGLAPPARTGAHATDVFVWNPHPWPQRARVRATVLFPNPEGEFGPPPEIAALAAVDADGRAVPLAVLASQADVMRVAFLEQTWGRRVEIALDVDLPPLGYEVVHVFSADRAAAPEPPPAGVRLHATADGLALTALGRTHARVLRFAYDADAGDTYSFSPVPEQPTRWATFQAAAPDPADPRRLVARYEISVPEGLDTDAEVTIPITVEAHVEPAGHAAFRVRYRNTARNGRLRAVLPTGIASDVALCGALFGFVERTRPVAVAPEDAPARYAAYPGELVYTTQHHEDLVAVEGPAHTAYVADRGLPEHELIPGATGTDLALTLHRAVGFLSVRNGRVRRCGAGPELPTPGAQCLREIEAEFALGFTDVGREAMVRKAKTFAHPPWAREMPHLAGLPAAGTAPRRRSVLSVDDPAVLVLSLRPEDDGPGTVVRLLNPTAEPRTATLRTSLPAGRACPTDLRDRWSDADARAVRAGRAEGNLGPHAVATTVLRPAG